jgi:DnaJ-class molecular chaperone
VGEQDVEPDVVHDADEAGVTVDAEVEITLADAYSGVTKAAVDLGGAGDAANSVEIELPAGVEDGAILQVRRPTQTGPLEPNLALVRVRLRRESRFERHGVDLRTRFMLALKVAVLGGEAIVGLPDGTRITLQVPPGTQNGQIFRLRGRGMPRAVGLGSGDVTPLGGERGSLYAEAVVRLPTGLSEGQRRAFEAFARELDEGGR